MLRRSDFLLRFGGLALVLSLGIALVMSRVLYASQETKINQQATLATVGQASAAFTPVVESGNAARYSAAARALMESNPNLFDVRVYRPNGTATFPATIPPATRWVQQAIQKEDTVQTPITQSSKGPFFTVYTPFANLSGNGYAMVFALDISQGALDALDTTEQRFVFDVTWGACAFIFVSLLVLAIAAQRELNRRQRLADETFRGTMTGIAAIVDKRDPYTAGHSKRVAEYAVKLANRMRLKERMVNTIEASALLHDLGKIGIPDMVLLKPAKLDERERQIIGLHPEIASEILSGVEGMAELVPCILHHHERWDGRGYPKKIAGEEIPLGARVIAVADTYDAMTTDRPYRRAMTPDQAREELLRGAGEQWDTRCVEAFVELIDAGSCPPPPPATDEELEQLAKSFGQQLPLDIQRRIGV
jgi:HD-GYP domain-containing protein (c-di-GMP phosphodiesterase class II)